MRFVVLSLALFAAAGCTRPSAGISFHDLVWAASDGLREYEGWVAAADDPFPNELCLAGIHFSASLAETKARSGSVGLPLASPAMGLSGMLGYQFVSTESETGTISATLEARYQKKPLPAEEAVNARKAFIESIPRLYTQRKVNEWKQGRVVEPKPLDAYRDRGRSVFSQRDDLAAELWRIRQAIHTAVLNSPKNVVLKPGPMILRVGYVATKSEGGQVSITLGGGEAGQFGASGGATEQNEMTLFFANNASPQDKMTCNEESVKDFDFVGKLKEARGQAAVASAPPPPKS